jgi:cell division protein ZapE
MVIRKARTGGHASKGLYVYGEVGRGKTMLMDLFFETSAVVRKRRVHFHEFMADVHERVYVYRQEIKNGEANEHDPIQRTAAQLLRKAGFCVSTNFISPTSPMP